MKQPVNNQNTFYDELGHQGQFVTIWEPKFAVNEYIICLQIMIAIQIADVFPLINIYD